MNRLKAYGAAIVIMCTNAQAAEDFFSTREGVVAGMAAGALTTYVMGAVGHGILQYLSQGETSNPLSLCRPSTCFAHLKAWLCPPPEPENPPVKVVLTLAHGGGDLPPRSKASMGSSSGEGSDNSPKGAS